MTSFIIIFVAIFVSYFAFATIISCSIAILEIRKLKTQELILEAKYKDEIIIIVLLSLFYVLITAIMYYLSKNFLNWLEGSIIGFFFSLTALTAKSREHTKKTVYRKCSGIPKNIPEHELVYLNDDMRKVADRLYVKLQQKYKFFYNIIEKEGFFKNYSYEKDNFTLLAYMYIFNCYKIGMIEKYGNDFMFGVFNICFFEISKNLTNSKYKQSLDVLSDYFVGTVLITFETFGKEALKRDHPPFIYFAMSFLMIVFEVSPDIIDGDLTALQELENLLADSVDEGAYM